MFHFLTLSIFKMHVVNVNIVFVWVFDVQCFLLFDILVLTFDAAFFIF